MGRYLKTALVIAAVMAAVACSRGPKVIPKAKFQNIYEDMLLADQWIASHAEAQVASDTALFYQPVFSRYGYDYDDYLASVEYYLRDPRRYSKMMKQVSLDLEKKGKKLRKELNPDSQPVEEKSFRTVDDEETEEIVETRKSRRNRKKNKEEQTDEQDS